MCALSNFQNQILIQKHSNAGSIAGLEKTKFNTVRSHPTVFHFSLPFLKEGKLNFAPKGQIYIKQSKSAKNDNVFVHDQLPEETVLQFSVYFKSCLTNDNDSWKWFLQKTVVDKWHLAPNPAILATYL